MVQLPCEYTGGEITIRHDGEKQTFRHDHTRRSVDCFSYVAFFAECAYGSGTISSGCRLCLVYNLVKAGGTGDRPAAKKGLRAKAVSLQQALQQWSRKQVSSGCDDLVGMKLVLMETGGSAVELIKRAEVSYGHDSIHRILYTAYPTPYTVF
jgi:hypothetical protein